MNPIPRRKSRPQTCLRVKNLIWMRVKMQIPLRRLNKLKPN